VQRWSDIDGRVTGGGKGIAYLRDHFEPEMSVVATERLAALRRLPRDDSQDTR